MVIGGLSVGTLSGPGIEELSISGGLRGVHSGGILVVSDNGVVIIDVGLQNSLSGDGISSLLSESSKLLSPGGDSRVL